MTYKLGTNKLSSHFEELPSSYPNSSSSDISSWHILGAGTGLIAASAVASANSLITLLPLAVEAVRIAFRTGFYVGDVTGRLVGLRDVDSWSTVVAISDKKAAEIALEELNHIHVKYASSSNDVLSLISLRGPPSPIKHGLVRMRPILSPSVARRLGDACWQNQVLFHAHNSGTSAPVDPTMRAICIRLKMLTRSLAPTPEQCSVSQKSTSPSIQVSRVSHLPHRLPMICSNNVLLKSFASHCAGIELSRNVLLAL